MVVDAPAAAVWRAGGFDGMPLYPLAPESPMRFLADPFALWRGGRLHIFVEAYDYRTRRGAIDVLLLDAAFAVTERRRVLDEPWHLSYPIVFEAEGDIWMLPEAHRSGALTLYRAVDFPGRWARAAVLALDAPPVDATPFRHEGLWWLAYSPAKSGPALHLAWADRLAGPWHPHPGNPVRRDAEGARPGGTPVMVDGALVLPVQDCGRTYGGGLRPLTITTLTPDRFVATLGSALAIPAALAPFTEGLHTLSAAGPVTLIDVKRTVLDARSLAVLAFRRRRAAAR